jgi:hypothetical protein
MLHNSLLRFEVGVGGASEAGASKDLLLFSSDCAGLHMARRGGAAQAGRERGREGGREEGGGKGRHCLLLVARPPPLRVAAAASSASLALFFSSDAYLFFKSTSGVLDSSSLALYYV